MGFDIMYLHDYLGIYRGNRTAQPIIDGILKDPNSLNSRAFAVMSIHAMDGGKELLRDILVQASQKGHLMDMLQSSPGIKSALNNTPVDPNLLNPLVEIAILDPKKLDIISSNLPKQAQESFLKDLANKKIEINISKSKFTNAKTPSDIEQAARVLVANKAYLPKFSAEVAVAEDMIKNNDFSKSYKDRFADVMTAKFANAQTLEEFKGVSVEIVRNKTLISDNLKQFVTAAEKMLESPGLTIDIPAVGRTVIDPNYDAKNQALAPKAKEYVTKFAQGLQDGTTRSITATNFNPSQTNIYNNATIAIYETGQSQTSRGEALIKEADKFVKAIGTKEKADETKVAALSEFITENYPHILHFMSNTTGREKDFPSLMRSGSFFMSQDPEFIKRWGEHHDLREEFQVKLTEFIAGGMQNPEEFEEYLQGTSQKVMGFIKKDIEMLPGKQRDIDTKGQVVEKDFTFKAKMTRDQMLNNLSEQSKEVATKTLGLTTVFGGIDAKYKAAEVQRGYRDIMKEIMPMFAGEIAKQISLDPSLISNPTVDQKLISDLSDNLAGALVTTIEGKNGIKLNDLERDKLKQLVSKEMQPIAEETFSEIKDSLANAYKKYGIAPSTDLAAAVMKFEKITGKDSIQLINEIISSTSFMQEIEFHSLAVKAGEIATKAERDVVALTKSIDTYKQELGLGEEIKSIEQYEEVTKRYAQNLSSVQELMLEEGKILADIKSKHEIAKRQSEQATKMLETARGFPSQKENLMEAANLDLKMQKQLKVTQEQLDETQKRYAGVVKWHEEATKMQETAAKLEKAAKELPSLQKQAEAARKYEEQAKEKEQKRAETRPDKISQLFQQVFESTSSKIKTDTYTIGIIAVNKVAPEMHNAQIGTYKKVVNDLIPYLQQTMLQDYAEKYPNIKQAEFTARYTEIFNNRVIAGIEKETGKKFSSEEKAEFIRSINPGSRDIVNATFRSVKNAGELVYEVSEEGYGISKDSPLIKNIALMQDKLKPLDQKIINDSAIDMHKSTARFSTLENAKSNEIMAELMPKYAQAMVGAYIRNPKITEQAAIREFSTAFASDLVEQIEKKTGQKLQMSPQERVVFITSVAKDLAPQIGNMFREVKTSAERTLDAHDVDISKDLLTELVRTKKTNLSKEIVENTEFMKRTKQEQTQTLTPKAQISEPLVEKKKDSRIVSLLKATLPKTARRAAFGLEKADVDKLIDNFRNAKSDTQILKAAKVIAKYSDYFQGENRHFATLANNIAGGRTSGVSPAYNLTTGGLSDQAEDRAEFVRFMQNLAQGKAKSLTADLSKLELSSNNANNIAINFISNDKTSGAYQRATTGIGTFLKQNGKSKNSKEALSALQSTIVEKYPLTMHLIGNVDIMQDRLPLMMYGSHFMEKDPKFVQRWQEHNALKEEFTQKLKEFVEGGMKNPEEFERYMQKTSKKVAEIYKADIKVMPENAKFGDKSKAKALEKLESYVAGIKSTSLHLPAALIQATTPKPELSPVEKQTQVLEAAGLIPAKKGTVNIELTGNEINKQSADKALRAFDAEPKPTTVRFIGTKINKAGELEAVSLLVEKNSKGLLHIVPEKDNPALKEGKITVAEKAHSSFAEKHQVKLKSPHAQLERGSI